MHGLDRGQILFDDVVELAASFVHVTQHAAQDAFIRIGFDEDLDVEDVAQLLRLEDQDALDDDDMARLDNGGFLRAVVLREIIDGAFDTVSFTQFLEVLDEQIRLKGVGVVVVDRLTLLEGQVVVRCIVVI